MSQETAPRQGPRLIEFAPRTSRRSLAAGLAVGALALVPFRGFAETPTGAYGGGGGDESSADAASLLFTSVLTEQAADVCAAIVTEQVLSLTPEGVFIGPDGVLKSVAKLSAAIPNGWFTILERFDGDGAISLHWSLTGNHLGDFEGFAPTGAAVTFEGISLVQVQRLRVPEHHWQYDERISRHNMEYDRMGLMEKLQNPTNVPIDRPHSQPY